MAGTFMGLAVPLYPDTLTNIIPQAAMATVYQVGDSTTGISRAAGTTMIYGYAYQKTTALTGTNRAVRGNAIVYIDASTGTAIGVEGRVGNGTNAATHDGITLGTAKGGYFYVAGSGEGTSGATITTAIAVDAQLDVDSSGLTVTNAYGMRINIQGGQGSTLTNLYGLVIEHESVDGTGATMDAAILVKSVNGNEPITLFADLSNAALAVHDTDQYPIFKLPGGVVLSWDVSASAWVSST